MRTFHQLTPFTHRVVRRLGGGNFGVSRLGALACLLLWAGGLPGAYAQAPLVVQGQVVDGATGEPLPAAAVAVARNKIGTVTNGQGNFVIKVPAAYRHDTLTFTYLSYLPVKVALRDVRPGPLRVGLVPAPFQLDEVVVKAHFSARDTIRKAIRAISRNYSSGPLLLEGFYRETLSEDAAQRYLVYAEGLLEIYKAPYNAAGQEDQVRLKKGRKKKLDPVYALPPLTNGPAVGVLLDVVKYRDFFTGPGNLNRYRYAYAGPATVDGEDAYMIDFEPNGDFQRQAYFKGRVYLHAEHLAFMRAEYQLSRPGLDVTNHDQPLVAVTRREYEVNYGQYQGRWCLQNGSIRNQLLHLETKTPLTSFIQFTVTQKTGAAVSRFDPKQIIRSDQMFTELIRQADDDYWEDFNIIREN